MTLPPAFFERPFAHRALHDKARGRPENSRAAVRAAIAAGYGIEIDLQASSDMVPMVFHDYDMGRLTGVRGAIRTRAAAELARTSLLGGEEGVPTLSEVLEIVDGRVPLLIEIKDQDGSLGPNVGALEAEVAEALKGYGGLVALMSFNPHSVAVCARLLPEIPRGLTTDPYSASDWPTVPSARRAELAAIPDYGRVGACFISHNWRDLSSPRVAELKRDGAAILCWTVRSAQEEAAARKVADNVTFEGYDA